MRYVGLIDDAGVYQAWRVPDPTAPYPQDYIIDQQGRIAYWQDQFDPQQVIATIDRLLGAGVEERPTPSTPCLTLDICPNPLRSGFATLRWDMTEFGSANSDRVPSLSVFDASGRCVQRLTLDIGHSSLSLDLRSMRAGVYLVRLSADGFTLTQRTVLVR